jgi:hypothetical protein
MQVTDLVLTLDVMLYCKNINILEIMLAITHNSVQYNVLNCNNVWCDISQQLKIVIITYYPLSLFLY